MHVSPDQSMACDRDGCLWYHILPLPPPPPHLDAPSRLNNPLTPPHCLYPLPLDCCTEPMHILFCLLFASLDLELDLHFEEEFQ